LTVVESLAGHPTGHDACRAAGVTASELDSYERALDRLAESGMIRPREGS
jgi:putative mycofactocin binding protein MftB